ncbi:unnamed protein product [Microthlaspi erraticum]|uniref:F-box domain-containing protein n=1 Tax=Microthlaspi erraticum TaxID=1685480 RepID=A0A6D2HXM0_9BRAS|nr:unnamed protein product [Microthlaspi erraticum]
MEMRQHEATREIPFDLVIEILWRLPAKSLMRFKSVSKHWLSLTISQYFTKRFPRVSPSAQRLYFKDKNVLLSTSALSDLDGTTMSSIVVDQEATIPAMEDYSVSHVFHGLMCF